MDSPNFQDLCRICLTKNSNMILLKSNVKTQESTTTSIIAMLSSVFNYMVSESQNHPKFICSGCLDILKISHDFKLLYEETRQILQQCLGELEVARKSENLKLTINTEESKACVEIIAGSNKYNLNDLIIVEDQTISSEEVNFEGFLKNLGKTVSATFVNAKHNNHNISSVKNEETIKSKLNNVDQYIIADEKEKNKNQEAEYIFIDGRDYYPKNQLNVEETDSENLIESALSLKYECNFCKKVYASEYRFENHTKLCGIDNIQCPYCLKKFKEKKFLTYHIKTSHKVPFFTCDICNKRFSKRTALKYHKRTKHSGPQHICQYCGKNLSTPTALRGHLILHEPKTALCVCPVCGKSFHYKGGLYYHMKQHTNERKYQCEYCEKKFYTTSAFHRHSRTHTGVRPYNCGYCDKKFFSIGERKKHEYIHTGIKPYICEYCGKGFRSRFNLKVHWFNHSGDFNCDYCNRNFISRDVLQFHYKFKHKDIVSVQQ